MLPYDIPVRLFDYIQGKNEEGAVIPMTAPVVTTIKPSAGPFCASAFTVRFFVPKEFAKKTPIPDSSLDLNLHKTKARCVLVRTFSGFTSDFNVAEEAASLSLSVQTTSWANVTAVGGEAYSVAEYNSPFELFNRVNEIWVPFKDNVTDANDCVPSHGLLASL